ncbi:MAG: TonB-dependent receptor [Flavobacteriales bacterium]|nr:MAG: TonB-dependent receptor [Flavobacteriales bacterium]
MNFLPVWGRIFMCIFLATKFSLSAQNNDTLKASLGEVVVTASRNSMFLEDVPMPISVISREEILSMGAPRITEILQEQTGIQIVSDHGVGVQMQGMGSDYVMIMVNGEPLIGRTAGTFDLNRLGIHNIERIEIIKGPASALYGSEAMAGVINIITRSVDQMGHQVELATSYRSFNTSDLDVDWGYKNTSSEFGVAMNRFSTDGIRHEDAEFPTVRAYTFSPKLNWRPAKSLRIDLTTRLYTEEQFSQFDINGEEAPIQATGIRSEYTFLPKITYTPNMQHRFQLRQYITKFRFDEEWLRLSDASQYSTSFFHQDFYRTEIQYDFIPNTRHTLTTGAGYAPEIANASRFIEADMFQAAYVFAQHSWHISSNLNLLYGGRYDVHDAYNNRFSPKAGVNYKVSKVFSMQASIGGGYRAPDFRHLLLDFTNPVAGYSVFGSLNAAQRIQEMQQMGQIASVFLANSEVQNLQPEQSMAYNMGWRYNPVYFDSKLRFSGNVFYNDITNLIEFFPIARNVQGFNIFTYRNISRVRTYGKEINAALQLNSNLRFSFGYEYLRAEDLDVVDALNRGEVFRRNSQGVTERLQRSEYFGLFNRARHSGNFKIHYNHNSGWASSIRAIYRGAFAFGDINGNGIADTPEELAPPTLLINFRIEKTFRNNLLLESGVNNALGQVNPYEPTVAGRIWFVGARYTISTPKQKSST